MVHWRLLADGRLVISSFSEKNDELCPVVESNIRAELIVGGYVLTPTDKGTLIQYVVQSDLKGTIPTTVVNFVSQSQPLVVASIRRTLDKDSKKAGARPPPQFQTSYAYEGRHASDFFQPDIKRYRALSYMTVISFI